MADAPMSDDRLADLHAAARVDNAPGTFTHFLSLGLREALAEVERLRDELALFGKASLEWGVQHPLFGTEGVDGAVDAGAACLQRNASSVRQKWSVVTRFAGEWREAA